MPLQGHDPSASFAEDVVNDNETERRREAGKSAEDTSTQKGTLAEKRQDKRQKNNARQGERPTGHLQEIP